MKDNNKKLRENIELHAYNKKLSAKELLENARLEWSVEAMHWLLDVHFSEDKMKVRDMEVQKNLNLLRKIVINLVKQYQASLPKHIPMSNILKQNLFEIQELEKFITYFRDLDKLE